MKNKNILNKTNTTISHNLIIKMHNKLKQGYTDLTQSPLSASKKMTYNRLNYNHKYQ